MLKKKAINGFTLILSRRGFTLIELLITISIIAILASVGLVSYNKAQSIGRDARRKQDLRSIATALEIYYQQNQRFPCTQGTDTLTGWQLSSAGTGWLKDEALSGGATTGCPLTTTAPMGSAYINMLPTDPYGNSGNPALGTNFGYAYWSGILPANAKCPATPTNGKIYALVTRLENSSDPDANSTKAYTFCDGTTSVVSGSTDPSAFVITSQ